MGGGGGGEDAMTMEAVGRSWVTERLRGRESAVAVRLTRVLEEPFQSNAGFASMAELSSRSGAGGERVGGEEVEVEVEGGGGWVTVLEKLRGKRGGGGGGGGGAFARSYRAGEFLKTLKRKVDLVVKARSPARNIRGSSLVEKGLIKMTAFIIANSAASVAGWPELYGRAVNFEFNHSVLREQTAVCL